MKIRKLTEKGLTIVELLVTLAVVFLLTILLLPTSHVDRKKRVQRWVCKNNLKEVGLAFRTWADEHDGRLPMQLSLTNGGTLESAGLGMEHHFLAISNESITPKIFVCPADSKRRPADKFVSRFSTNAISYFVGIDCNLNDPQLLLTGDRNITNSPL